MTTKQYHNVLCVRADNMGDVMMSSPAIRAIKETFGCRITMLTSQAGAVIIPFLDCIDDEIVVDLPWVKTGGEGDAALVSLAEEIRSRDFDAGVIFTVYSQSSLPSAMLLYMAGVPVRAAYARENPYDLLNHWVPDTEPFEHIIHQVQRDLDLAASLGAMVGDTHIRLRPGEQDMEFSQRILTETGHDLHQPYLILHPGVSELKRAYPAELWIEAGKLLIQKYRLPLFVTGSSAERDLAGRIADAIGPGAFSVAGTFTLGAFICLIKNSRCVVSVNTGTIHIAAAMQTPAVVLYANTNPQHTPWRSPHEVLPFSVPAQLKSRNAVIRYVDQKRYAGEVPYPGPWDVLKAVEKQIGISGIHAGSSGSDMHDPSIQFAG
jgi:ADP-heptose:LPS heptosyltransferase